MSSRGRAVAVLLAVAVGVTACAGSEQAEPADEVAAASETEGSTETAAPSATAALGETPTSTDASVRRELGLALRSEADVSTNLLPPVEVHDVGQNRMVNFKNIFPAEQPVLLWMWAPF